MQSCPFYIMDQENLKTSPNKSAIQKLYNALANPGAPIEYPKTHKKFIKDVVTGTERSDLIEDQVKSSSK